MDKKAGLRSFVRSNIDILLDKKPSYRKIKGKKFTYFRDQLSGQVGMPKNTEIAREVCSMLVESGHVNSCEGLEDLIKKAPFVNKNIYEKDKPWLESLFERRRPEPIVSRDDIRKMHREEYRKKKEDDFVKSAESKLSAQIAEKEQQAREEAESLLREDRELLERDKAILEEERAELEIFKSEIDKYAEIKIEDIPYIPPSSEAIEPRDGLIWWERLGLFQNPFPTTDGLSKIDEKYYDELVLKTEVFQDYYSLVTKHPDELLNRTCLIVGQFGSGKTTLFDYLGKPMITHDLLPIHVILDAEGDAEDILRSFFKCLFHELSDLYHGITGQDPRSFYTNPAKEELLGMMELIRKEKKRKGIILMLDGLHKNESKSQTALKFIQMLQNTKDYWVRKGLDISLLIAGSKAWELELGQDPSLRGSINRTDRIQEITSDQAFDMISKRLETFSEEKDRPTKVRKAAVEKAYNIFKKKYPGEITFRDIVDEILPYLETKNRVYVEISLPFDRELLDKMTAEAANFPKALRRIERLRERPDAFVPALQILSIILEKKRIRETDRVFSENSSLFAMLLRVGLIQKVRERGGKGFYWGPSRLLTNFSRHMEKRFKMKAASFMIDLFQEREEIIPTRAESEEIHLLKSLIATHQSSDSLLANAMKDALAKFEKIDKNAISPVDIIPLSEIRKETTEAVEAFLKVLFWTIEPRKEQFFFGKTPREWLADSWVTSSDVLEYWNELDRLGRIQPTKKEAAELTSSCRRALRDFSRLVEIMLRVNHIVDLSSPDLSKSDKRELHQCRLDFSREDFFESCRRLTDHLEKRLRNFLYDIFQLKYGEKWRARMGKRANTYIKGQKERSRTMLAPIQGSMNDLYNCTRQHYRTMITEVDGNWSQVFGHCFGYDGMLFVEDYLSRLFALSDKDKHNLPNEFFKENSDKLLLSLQQTPRFLGYINRAYIKTVLPENVFADTVNGDVHMFFSFMELKDKSNLNKLVISQERGQAISKKLERQLSESELILDLADHDEVEYRLGAKYREAIGVLCYAIRSGMLVTESSSGSLIVLRHP